MSVAIESSPELLERFAVSAPLEVRAAIEDLLRGHAPITVQAHAASAEPFDTSLLAIERATLLLDAGRRAEEAQALPPCGSATVVGLLDRLKVQFEVRDLRAHEGGSMLVCTLPSRIARIQRRDAYRVRPAHPAPAQCVLRFADHTERSYPIVDISATGLALKIPAHEVAPAIGQRWQHCRVEAPGYAPIPCELEARFLGEQLAGEAPGPRLGCLFVRPPPEVQRALQVYVMDVERGRAPPEATSEATPACS